MLQAGTNDPSRGWLASKDYPNATSAVAAGNYWHNRSSVHLHRRWPFEDAELAADNRINPDCHHL